MDFVQTATGDHVATASIIRLVQTSDGWTAYLTGGAVVHLPQATGDALIGKTPPKRATK